MILFAQGDEGGFILLLSSVVFFSWECVCVWGGGGGGGGGYIWSLGVINATSEACFQFIQFYAYRLVTEETHYIITCLPQLLHIHR